MKSKDEFVFPSIHVSDVFPSAGLTKRELFAAVGMMALLQDRSSIYTLDSIVKGAVQYADKLIEELEK